MRENKTKDQCQFMCIDCALHRKVDFLHGVSITIDFCSVLSIT
jgi:hypothetical protein